LPGFDANPGLVPRIRLDSEEITVGPIPNDDYFMTQTTVYNDGGADLVISSIDTTCTCTEGHMEQTTIGPGKSAVMEIRLNPYLMSPFKTTKELTIRSNDPKNRGLILPVTTLVSPEFSADPMEIDFGTVHKGETPSARIHLKQITD